MSDEYLLEPAGGRLSDGGGQAYRGGGPEQGPEVEWRADARVKARAEGVPDQREALLSASLC